MDHGDKGVFQRLFGEYRFFGCAFLVVLIDQIVKLTVKFSMVPYEEVKVIGETVRINYIENEGAAFGLTIRDLFQKVGIDVSDHTAKLILTVFSILAVIVIIYLLQLVRNSRTSLPYFLSLILGGAIGNIIDRVFYGAWFAGINDYEGGLLHGRVVDMFYVNLVHGDLFGIPVNLLPVFNIADVAIAVGIIAIIVFQRRFFKANATEPDSTTATVATAAADTDLAQDEALLEEPRPSE